MQTNRSIHDPSEVALLTLSSFGPSVRIRIGGLVTARSVKYLGKLASKLSDQETRDGWWSELRDEIRSHARTLCCWHVVGYTESSTIHDDVCVLSITGTAATVRGLPDLTKDYRLRRHWEMQRMSMQMTHASSSSTALRAPAQQEAENETSASEAEESASRQQVRASLLAKSKC